MPRYLVTCIKPNGGATRRRIDAPNAAIVRSRLLSEGLFPNTPVAIPDPLSRYKIPRKVFMRLCHEFAENLSGDPTFTDILKLLREHFDHAKTRKILGAIHDAISNGESSPADAFARYPRSFPSDVIEILRSGFGSGQDALAQRFRDLAIRLEDAEQRKSELSAALAYPLVLLGGVLGLLTFAFSYFLPKFKPLLSAYNAKLPPVSEYLFAIGGFTQKYFISGVLLVIGVIVGATFLYRVRAIRFAVDKCLLRVPLLGHIIRYLITSEVCSNYRTLANAKIDAPIVLRSCAAAVQNRYARHVLLSMEELVGARGYSVDNAFVATSHLWAPESIPSIVTGAVSGRLPEQMAHISRICSAAAKVKSQRFFTVLRYAALLVMGGILGVVVYGLFIPLVEIALNI